jgi:hypothetical protein
MPVMDGLKEYDVNFTLNGKRMGDSVRAGSNNDARKVILMRYPGASNLDVKESKGCCK